jgi:hypothetical protein
VGLKERVVVNRMGMKRSMLDFEGRAICDLTFSAGGFGDGIFAVAAGDDGLCMTEDDSRFTAPPTLDIHEVGVAAGDQSFKLMGLLLLLKAGMEQVSIHLLKYYDNIYSSITQTKVYYHLSTVRFPLVPIHWPLDFKIYFSQLADFTTLPLNSPRKLTCS